MLESLGVFIQALPWAMLVIALIIVLLTFYVHLRRAITKKPEVSEAYFPTKTPHRIAFLIASKDGDKTIESAVKAAKRNHRSVFVVSDGSTDKTAQVAREAGANVLALRKNIGKPSALHRAYRHFNLGKRFDAIAILDDDVLVDKHFIFNAKDQMNEEVAISVGKNITYWPDSRKWNIWIAVRAYSYWSYQITLRQIQSSFNVMNCISGSNSVYRTEVLDKVLGPNTPYIVDDTYWTLETHRLSLGKIVYAPKASAYIQDPTSLRDWYKQNLRWMWGTFQGIFGHQIGSQLNKFHLSYLALITQWIFYILSGPILIWLLSVGGMILLPLQLLVLLFGYALWVFVASISLGKHRLILFTPAIILADFLFRVVMIHAFIKVLRYRTVDNCIWESPKRIASS